MAMKAKRIVPIFVATILSFSLFSVSAQTPSFAIVESHSISCHGYADGELSLATDDNVTVDGGYSIKWSTGGDEITTYRNKKVVKSLSAGKYTVEVKNNSSTIVFTDTYTLEEPVEFKPGITTIACTHWGAAQNASNGSITITPTGGTAPYSMTIYDQTYQTTIATVSNTTNYNKSSLMAGDYTVTITDAKGCALTKTATVKNYANGNNGTPSGTQYICYRSNGGQGLNAKTDDVFPITVMWDEIDDDTHKKTLDFYIYKKCQMEAVPGWDMDTVWMKRDKYVAVFDTAGRPVWDTLHNRQKIDTLIWGDTVAFFKTVIGDNNGYEEIILFRDYPGYCSEQNPNNPSAPVDAKCVVGTNPFYYQNGFGSTVIGLDGTVWKFVGEEKSGLGVSGLDVQNGSGDGSLHTCRYWEADGTGGRSSWTIKAPDSPITINATVTRHNKCYGESNGAITATARGSWQNYLESSGPFFSLSITPVDGTGANTSKASMTTNNIPGDYGLSGLSTGIYTITATINSPYGEAGSETCSRSQTEEITGPSVPMSIIFDKTHNATCPFQNNGSVSVQEVTNAVGNVTIRWGDGSEGSRLDALMSGMYYCTATDANGCTVSDSTNVGSKRKSCLYNFVTPNGDGCNDVFDLTDFSYGLKMKCNIFDINGRKMASLTEANPTWNPLEDTNQPPTGQSSTYTAFISLMRADGSHVADLAETFTVIFADFPDMTGGLPCNDNDEF